MGKQKVCTLPESDKKMALVVLKFLKCSNLNKSVSVFMAELTHEHGFDLLAEVQSNASAQSFIGKGNNVPLGASSDHGSVSRLSKVSRSKSLDSVSNHGPTTKRLGHTGKPSFLLSNDDSDSSSDDSSDDSSDSSSDEDEPKTTIVKKGHNSMTNTSSKPEKYDVSKDDKKSSKSFAPKLLTKQSELKIESDDVSDGDSSSESSSEHQPVKKGLQIRKTPADSDSEEESSSSNSSATDPLPISSTITKSINKSVESDAGDSSSSDGSTSSEEDEAIEARPQIKSVTDEGSSSSDNSDACKEMSMSEEVKSMREALARLRGLRSESTPEAAPASSSNASTAFEERKRRVEKKREGQSKPSRVHALRRAVSFSDDDEVKEIPRFDKSTKRELFYNKEDIRRFTVEDSTRKQQEQIEKMSAMLASFTIPK